MKTFNPASQPNRGQSPSQAELHGERKTFHRLHTELLAAVSRKNVPDDLLKEAEDAIASQEDKQPERWPTYEESDRGVKERMQELGLLPRRS